MARVQIIQHMEYEPAGTVGDVLSSAGIDLAVARPDLGDPISVYPEADGLVIMGGPMGVYEQDLYPFLTDEIRLIQNAAEREIPILGICLGGQLVAAAMGGDVAPGAEREIGWPAIHLTDDALADPLFGSLGPYMNAAPRSFHGFVWHGDYFTLPPSATRLAYSDMAPCQAIRCGKSVYGLQLHPEVSKSTVESWVEAWPDQLVDSGIDAGRMLEETDCYIENLKAVCTQITEGWLHLVWESAARRAVVMNA